MKSVLVTGAPGWLGNTLLKKIQPMGLRIHLIVDPVFTGVEINKLLPAISDDQMRVTYCDLRDKEKLSSAISGCDTVLHMAAVQHPRTIKELYSINAEASAALAELAAKSAVEKFIFVSSCSVQGPSANATNELMPLTGCTHYTMSKIAAESKLQKIKEQFGMHLVIIRPGVFYGTDASVNMNKLMDMIRQKPVPVFGPNGFKRTYVQIEKVAEALVLAAERGRSGDAYLIGDLEPLTTREFYETIAEGLGCKARIVSLPTVVSRLAEATTFAIGSGLNRHFRMGNIIGEFGRPTFFSSVKSTDLGFQQLPSSRVGLKEMATTYRSALEKNNDQLYRH